MKQDARPQQPTLPVGDVSTDRPLITRTVREGYLQLGPTVGAPIERRRPATPKGAVPAIGAPRGAGRAASAAPSVAVSAPHAPLAGARRPSKPEAPGAEAPAAALPAAAGPRLDVASAGGMAGQGGGGPGRPSVEFFHDRPAPALEGSTIADARARVAAAGGQQRNRALLRIVVPAGPLGAAAQIFELRVLVLANGRDVIRYTVYRDDGAGGGFSAEGSCRLWLQLRQAQVLAATPDRPAEVHLRYQGQLVAGAAVVDFDGMSLLNGQGNLRAVVPTVSGGDAMGVVAEGTVEIGWA